MALQTIDKETEEDTPETSYYQKRGGIWSRENFKQMSSVEKGEILSTMERVYGKRKYMGKQGKFRKCKRVSRRVWEGVWGRGRRT